MDIIGQNILFFKLQAIFMEDFVVEASPVDDQSKVIDRFPMNLIRQSLHCNGFG